MRLFLPICLMSVTFGQAIAQTKQKDLEKNYEKAIKSFEKNNYPEGYKYLNECFKIDSLWRDALYGKAFFELEEERYQEAEQSFSKVLKHYPNDTASYLGRARAKVNMELFDQAQRDVQRVLQMDSTHTQALTDMGYVYATAGYPKAAQEFFDKALKYSPQNSQIYQLKSYAYWLDKDLDGASIYAEKALEKDKENLDALKLKAYIAYDKNRFAETIKTFESVLKKNKYAFEEDDFYYWAMAHYKLKNYKKALEIFQSYPNVQNPFLYYGQALCYFQNKQYEKAWEMMLQAEKTKKNLTAEFYYDKAIIAHYAKKSEAKAIYTQALSMMPELFLQKNEKDEKAEVLTDAGKLLNSQFSKEELNNLLIAAYQERSLNLLQESDKKQAFKDIEKALKMDSLNSRSYTIRGIVYAMEGDFSSSNKDFEKAEKLPKERNYEYLYMMRGLAAAEAENFGQAIYYLDKAIAVNPQNPTYYAEKAHILFEIDSVEEALLNIEKAIQLNPKETEYRLEKIGYLYGDEQMDKVLSESEALLKLDPDVVEVYFYRGMAHLAKNNKSQAKKDLELFLVYYPDDEEAQKALQNIK